jgi:two-component system, cell cycle sensor histidine kinase and response regulator CckA
MSERSTDTATSGLATDFGQIQRFAADALELSPYAVYWIRCDGSLVYVNQAACDMLEYTREELLSLGMLPINLDMTPERWAQVWQALVQQKHRRFTSVHRARDGRVIPVEVTATIFELDGEQFSCAFSRDVADQNRVIEEHRREHAFLQSLIEMAPVMIVVFNANGGIVLFNRCAERVSGYALDDVRAASWIDLLVHESDRPKVERLMRQSLAGSNPQGVVYRLKTKSGETKEIAWSAQLMSSTDAHGVGLLTVGVDVTEQRELEQRLRQAEKLEAIGKLAGGVAHDFNNQLTGIMGWTEILGLEAPPNPTFTECITRIMQASRRASDLTAQLLAYSRKGKLITRPVDLHVIVREAVAILERSIDKRIAVVLDLAAPQCETIGDATQLGNAILNLALNARDAMPEGGELTIATRTVHLDANQLRDCPHEVTPGEFIELSVCDTGTGISEEVQRRMFEPFFTTKEEGRGTGMGLAAVYGTVSNHRGTIDVMSSIGRGTQVRIHLPLGLAASDESAQDFRAVAASVGPLSVMVVDDEDSVRELTKRLLIHLGCQVTVLHDGFQAVEHYRQAWRSVDAVLLDMAMPVLDGKSTFYALRRINPAVRVILMSGYSVDGAAQGLLDEGALAFIRKPFTLEMVTEALSRVPTPPDAAASDDDTASE